ncbi:MAG: hypothetical protein GX676_00655 [Bacilli bacterium]|nr:hypothetical protein [Bacilli bacterium]
MIKLLKNLGVSLFIVLAIIFMISQPEEVMNAVKLSLTIWVARIFPVLFPFYLFSSLAIKYSIAKFIGDTFAPITKTLFRTGNISGFVLMMSLISGNPGSAIIINELYSEKLITKKEALHYLSFCVFANPLFILGSIGVGLYQNYSIGVIILLSHILANLILGFLLRFVYRYETNTESKVQNFQKYSFGYYLTETLQKGINTMFLIAGFIIFFNIVIMMLKNSGLIALTYQIIKPLKIPYNVYESFIVGLLEMVSGVDYIYQLDLPKRLSVTLITMIISFGGFSVHLQIQSILLNLKLKYLPFFIARLGQMIIGGILSYLLFPSLYKEKTIQTGKFLSESFYHKGFILLTIILLSIVLIIFIINQLINNDKLKRISQSN